MAGGRVGTRKVSGVNQKEGAGRALADRLA
jgi:hypothetical protein